MGVLSDLIVADRSEAQAIIDAHGTHDRTWPVLESKGINEVKLESLWSALPGGSRDPAFMDATSCVYRAKGGPWVMVVPPPMVLALSNVADNELDRLAAAWADTDEGREEGWSADGARDFLVELVAIARRAREAQKDLLLWTCL